MLIHGLRHNEGTLLLGQCINTLVVSYMLGQAHIAITLGIYGHVSSDRQCKTAAALLRGFAPLQESVQKQPMR